MASVKTEDPKQILADARDFYFVGIGGAGMSALARHFHAQGRRVRGYDRGPSEFTRLLEAQGIPIRTELGSEAIADFGRPDVVIYTPAVDGEMPLLARARDLACPLWKRSFVLGLLSATARTLCVAGTHGKTTTSTMAAHLLRSCGVDASAFVGGVSPNLGGNYARGSADVMVVEADEYDRSFLHLHPHTAIVTFTEPDHLDVYGSSDAVLQAYLAFVGLLPAEGRLFVRHEEPARLDLFAGTKAPALSYGLSPEADCHPTALRVEAGAYRFGFSSPFGDLSDLLLRQPGRHNVENATAALAAALALGADAKRLPEALASFRGSSRRFEIILDSPRLVMVDDYAHHPTEIAAVIAAAREMYPDRRICAVFQPHLYSRTRDFATDFARALGRSDRAFVLPIYAAREAPLAGVSAQSIAAAIPHGSTLPEDGLTSLARELEGEGDWLLLCAGAGSVSALARTAAESVANDADRRA